MSVRTPASLRERLAREGGFTLPELLMTIVITSIIVVVLTSTFTVSVRSQAATKTRLDESHDAQMAAAYFQADASNAKTFDSSAPVPGSCATGLTNLAHFQWTDTGGIKDVYYATSGSPAVLVRRACVNNVASPDVRLVKHLSATTPATVTCPAPAGACSATPADVQINVVETSGYSYALRGVPRPMPALPPLGGGGPEFAVYVGSGGMSLKGNSTITNSSSLLIAVNSDLTCSGSGVNVSNPFVVSGSIDKTCKGSAPTAGSVPADPLRGIPYPDPPDAAKPPKPKGTDCGAPQLTYQPGRYTSPQTFTNACLASGLYYFDQGVALSNVKSAGDPAAGTGGVMLYVPPSAVPPEPPGSYGIAFNGDVQLHPLSSSPDPKVTPGVTIFLGRSNPGAVTLSGNSKTNFTVYGALYAPFGKLTLQNANTSLKVGMVDVKTLEFGGNAGQITLI